MSEREPVLRNEHFVVFYEDDQELVEATTHFFDEGAAGCVSLLLAAEHHKALLTSAVPDGRYVNAEKLLGSFCRDGVLDVAAFERNVGDVVRLAGNEGRPVLIVAETVALLWEQGLVAQAIELETLWAQLAETVPFALLSAYPSTVVLDSDQAHAVNEVAEQVKVRPAQPVDAAIVRAFPPAFDSIRGARKVVAEFVGDTGNQGDKVLLIVSELATNAVRHAATPFVVEVVRKAGVICVSVRDRSKTEVGVHAAPMNEEAGRGMSVVDALSDSWGVRFTAQGKVVWAEVNPDEDE